MSIPTALFIKRRHGREPGAFARSSVRRAGGAGPSLMARRSSGKSGVGLRRRALVAARREDRISALPDDLLLLVLRRLDIRSALGSAVLSRRWAHLPRELDALDLRLADMLPPRYHRMVDLYNDARSKGTLRHAVGFHIVHSIRRYERRAMRAFASSMVTSFLEGPRRNVKRLRLEFVVTGNTGCVNGLVAEAMDAWGVEDLEVVAKSTFSRRDGIHSFPSHGLCEQPHSSCLRSLKLGGCTLPPLHEYTRLSVLVLKGIPRSTPAATFEGIFTLCLQLRVLHLISCGCIVSTLVVDSPRSEIRELVLEDCIFGQVWLKALPCLERLASGCGVLFESFGSFPCLKQRNLTIRLGLERAHHLELDTFLEWTPDITDLILRLTGPNMWIVPSSSPSALLPHLRRLLVADVPSSWDVTWPHLLLEMAPSLESLHIHIAPCGLELGEEIDWPPTKLWHHNLREFVVAGFEGTERQVYLVKLFVGACTALRLVAIFKNGCAREDKGRWGWDMATQQQHLWTSEEKEKVLKQVMDAVPSSTNVQVVLG